MCFRISKLVKVVVIISLVAASVDCHVCRYVSELNSPNVNASRVTYDVTCNSQDIGNYSLSEAEYSDRAEKSLLNSISATAVPVIAIRFRYHKCERLPVDGLFANAFKRVVQQRPEPMQSRLVLELEADDITTSLEAETFNGLRSGVAVLPVLELYLIGFRQLMSLDEEVFRPLKSLEKLFLVGFGREHVPFGVLGKAFAGFPVDAALRTVVMHDVRSGVISEPLDVGQLMAFPRGVSIAEWVLSDSVIKREIVGRLTVILPQVEYVCIGADSTYYEADSAAFVVDAVVASRRLEELVFYQFAGVFNVYAPTFEVYDPTYRCGQYERGETVNNEKISNALSDDVRNKLDNLVPKSTCFLHVELPVSTSLKRLAILGSRMFYIFSRLCFNMDNYLIALDLTGSNMCYIEYITGLNRLRHLNLRNIRGDGDFLHKDFLKSFPQLEELRVSFIPQFSLADGRSLKRLDLSNINRIGHNAVRLSRDMFSGLEEVVEIDLSNNSLGSFDVTLNSSVCCQKLRLLNLSRNSLRVLPPSVIDQLDSIAAASVAIVSAEAGSYSRRAVHNSTNVIDVESSASSAAAAVVIVLEDNDLSCLCNATYFVQWLKHGQVTAKNSSASILFPLFDRLQCLYPNGSQLLLTDVSVEELRKKCSVLEDLDVYFNRTDVCPSCNNPATDITGTEMVERLAQIRFSIDQYVCRNVEDGDQYVMLSTLPLRCRGVDIVVWLLLGVIAVLVVGIMVAVLVLAYRAYRRRNIDITELADMDRLVRVALLWLLKRSHQSDDDSDRIPMLQRKVFLLIHPNNMSTLLPLFQTKLDVDVDETGSSTQTVLLTPEDVDLGSYLPTSLIECAAGCRCVIVVLTLSFLDDALYVDHVLRSLLLDRPHTVVPIYWALSDGFDIVNGMGEAIDRLVRDADPLRWSGDEDVVESDAFWQNLFNRIE